MSLSVPPAITVDEQSAAASPTNGWRLLLVLARVEAIRGRVVGWQTLYIMGAGLAAHLKFEFLLISAGLIAALGQRSALDISLILILILSHVGLAIFAAITAPYYIIPLSIVYTLLVAGLFRSPTPISSIGARHWGGVDSVASSGVG